MAKKTPLQLVNDVHGGKEKLVDALVGMLDRGDESKDDFRARLLAAPNSKLLRLHGAMTTIKERFGDTEKLVGSLLQLQDKSKDNDFRDKLLTRTPVQLVALHREAERRAKRKPKKRKVA